MRTFFVVVFDDIVQNTTDVYTDAAHNGLLGSADRMSFQVISNVFTGGPSLTVAVQHSADGRTWQPRSSAPEIDRDLLNWTDTNNHVVFYDTAASVGCLVRLRIALGGSATVRVKITACGRSRYRPPAPVIEFEVASAFEVDPFVTDDELLDDQTRRELAAASDVLGASDCGLQYLRESLRRDAWERRSARPATRSLLVPDSAAARNCGCSAMRAEPIPNGCAHDKG